MTKICPDCKEQNEDESIYCIKCGKNIEDVPITEIKKSFIEENQLPLIIVGATALLVMLFLVVSPSEMPNSAVFHIEGEPTQSVDVDGIFIKIPQEFRIDPRGIDYDYENFVMSSSKEWTHENERICMMILRTPSTTNLNEAIGINGGEQRNMYGYNGYYIEHDVNVYSFTFTKNNKICVIMVSSPYLFDKIKIE